MPLDIALEIYWHVLAWNPPRIFDELLTWAGRPSIETISASRASSSILNIGKKCRGETGGERHPRRRGVETRGMKSAEQPKRGVSAGPPCERVPKGLDGGSITERARARNYRNCRSTKSST